MSDTEMVTINFRIETDAPGYKVRLDDEYIKFNEQGTAQVEKPTGWDCMVYYELIDSQAGQFFELHVDKRERPVRIDVVTNKPVFGFTGFIAH